MRVLIFSPEKPYTGAESIVTAKLMRAMLNHGWEVEMIYHETEMMYSTDYDVHSIKKHSYGIENKKLKDFILRRKGKSLIFKKLTSLDSFLWVLRSYRLALKLRKRKNFDLVISRIMPQYGHLPALLFKLTGRKSKWIANWSDPLPRAKSPEPYGQGPGAKTRVLELLYVQLVVKTADHNTFPSERLMEYYWRYLPGVKSKCSVLPHVIIEKTDGHVWPGTSDDSITLTHLGGFGLRSPVKLIVAYKKLKDQKLLPGEIYFRFIGPIDEYIFQLIEQNNITSDFSLEGVKSYEETLEIIRQSDMMLVVEAPINEGIFLPSKVVDYLQYSKPILAISPRNGVMNDLIAHYGGGIVADCTSIEDISNALLRINGDVSLLKGSKGIYNTEKLKSKFSEETIVENIKEIYKKCNLN